MIILHVEANTIVELMRAARAALGSFEETTMAPTPSLPASAIPTVWAAEKRPPGRPPKATQLPLEAAPTPPPPPVPTPPAPTEGSVTFDQMKASLQKLSLIRLTGETDENAGLKRVTDMLMRFGVKKVKEVKPENFTDVFDRCEKKIAELTDQNKMAEVLE